jgi:hypothetical protein
MTEQAQHPLTINAIYRMVSYEHSLQGEGLKFKWSSQQTEEFIQARAGDVYWTHAWSYHFRTKIPKSWSDPLYIDLQRIRKDIDERRKIVIAHPMPSVMSDIAENYLLTEDEMVMVFHHPFLTNSQIGRITRAQITLGAPTMYSDQFRRKLYEPKSEYYDYLTDPTVPPIVNLWPRKA